MASRGIVVQINGEGEGARRALEMVRDKLRETQAEADRATGTFGRNTTSMHGMVPATAAASAGLRALEGNFTNNIRAGERFLTMLPGMAEALQAAFPYIGAVVLGTALIRVGAEAFHAYQNIVELKGAMQALDELEISVAKKSIEADDKVAAATKRRIEATQGHAAALRFDLSDQSNRKGLDLTDHFYDDKFKGLQTNIKADYETLYKSVAPADIPDRLKRIGAEVRNLQGALRTVQSGEMGMFVPKVGGFGPTATQDPEVYYKARIKAATEIQTRLQKGNDVRTSDFDALRAEIAAADKKEADKHTASDDSVTKARTTLQEKLATAELEGVRSTTRAKLAEEEAQHRMILSSDQQFMAAKMALQNEEFDAEQTALTKQVAAVQGKLKEQQGDRKLKRNGGVSPEELKTQSELVDLQAKQLELTSKRQAAESAYGADVDASNRAVELATLRIAAHLETERNQGIEARIALIRKEKDLEAQKATQAGGSEQDAASIRAGGELAVQKLQAQDLEQEMGRVRAAHSRTMADMGDAEAKTGLSKQTIAARTKAANAEELQSLQALVDKYRELAEATGDTAMLERVKDMDAELKNLGRKDTRGTFGRELTDGMQEMSQSIVENAALGRQSFGEMAKGILDDIDRMALKMAEQKFLQPLFDALGSSGGATGGAPTGSGGGFGSFIKGLFGAGGEHHMSGGVGSDLPQIVGDEGGHGELWTPPTRGGQYTTSAVLKRLAEGGSSSKVPNVTTNVVNQSSQPVNATTSQPSFDSQTREMVTHIILTDLHENGQIAQGFGH